MKWLSTGDFARLIEDHFPATAQSIREMCEEGVIPSSLAKRAPKRDGLGHWKIAVKGIRFILEKILELEPDEIREVQAKAPINFNRERAA